MNIPVPFIGGGSGDSDECTATAADVLESKTAIYNGSGDEPAAGSMKDYSGASQSATASLDSNNNRLQLAVPNTGKYDTKARLYSAFSTIASLIGLTADIIKKGQSILGITGTWEGYVADADDLYYRGVISDLGGSIVAYENSQSIVLDLDCIVCTTDGSSIVYFGFYFTNQINFRLYNSITLTFHMVTVPSGSSYDDSGIYVEILSDAPSSAAYLTPSSAVAYEFRTVIGTSVGTEYKVTLDVSSITESGYVTVALRSRNSSGYIYSLEITRVQID